MDDVRVGQMKENVLDAERQPVKCDGAPLLPARFHDIAMYQKRIDTCAEAAGGGAPDV